jgi:hypothetical protein
MTPEIKAEIPKQVLITILGKIIYGYVLNKYENGIQKSISI